MNRRIGFAGLSHRGSLLCLPDGIWAWPVAAPQLLTPETLALVFDSAARLDLFILGTGRDAWIVPPALCGRFREHAIGLGGNVKTFHLSFPYLRLIVGVCPPQHARGD